MTTPMPSDNKELLAEIEEIIMQYVEDEATPHGYPIDRDTAKLASEKIQALIADQCRLARIDELEGFEPDFDGGYYLKRHGNNVEDRVKALESNDG